MPLRNTNAAISFWMTSWKEPLMSHKMGLHGNILLNIARARELRPVIVTAWPQAHKLTVHPPTDRPRRRRCRCRLRRQLAAACAGASLPSWEQPVKSVKSGEEQPSWVCDPGRRGEGQVASRSFGKLGRSASQVWEFARVEKAAGADCSCQAAARLGSRSRSSVGSGSTRRTLSRMCTLGRAIRFRDPTTNAIMPADQSFAEDHT